MTKRSEHVRGTSPLVCIALFFLAVVGASMAIGRAMPPPEYFREKLNYFAAHKDQFDLIFFGASDMHWGVSPEIFDDQLGKHGIEMRSFNLAVPGSNGYEIDHLIRHVSGMQPARWQYAVIGWRAWRLEREPLIHERQIWWHSFEETVLLFQGLWLEPRGFGEKWPDVRNHAEDAIRNFLHLGLGPSLIGFWRDPPGPGRGKWDYLARTGGFEALGPETADDFWPQGARMREQFLAEQELFITRARATARRLADQRARGETEVAPYLATLFPRTVYAQQVQVDYLRRRGVEPIYLIPPTHEEDNIQRRLLVEGYLPALMAFNDPAEYPELYRLDLRYDHLHLTEEGAALYSRYVADRFAEWLKGRSPG